MIINIFMKLKFVIKNISSTDILCDQYFLKYDKNLTKYKFIFFSSKNILYLVFNNISLFILFIITIYYIYLYYFYYFNHVHNNYNNYKL